MTDLNAPFFTVLAVEDDHASYSFALCNAITGEGLLVSDTREALDSVCAIMNANPTISVGEAFAQSCAERGRLCFSQDSDDGDGWDREFYNGFDDSDFWYGESAFKRGDALAEGATPLFAEGWNAAAAEASADALAMVEARDALVDCTMLAIERACANRRRFIAHT